MSQTLDLGNGNDLPYDYCPPASPDDLSFVFVNPITGDLGLWNEKIVPALQARGFGTLVYNFRGQNGAHYTPGLKLNDELIIADLQALLSAVKPTRPVLAGLSIGGLYAARAFLQNSVVSGLILINTLRRITPRLEWMNAASLRVMQVGGPALMKDLYFHLLMGEPWQLANRAQFLTAEPDYSPLAPDSGAWNLLNQMGQTDWDIDWSAIAAPTLVITGTQDRVFYDKPIVDELFELLPDATRVDFNHAGHMLPAEQAEDFIDALLGFAGKLKG